MSKKAKIEDSLVKLEIALKRLNEALVEDDSNSLVVDGTIQRFEFVFELTWKTLKRALEAEGLVCQTPRETIKTAYASKWIDKENLWLQMLDDRNMTSHTYNEATARGIYENIIKYYAELVKLAQLIREKQKDEGS